MIITYCDIEHCSSECRHSECFNAECHYGECHYAECHYAECYYAERRVAAVSCILNNKDSPMSIFGNLVEPQGQCLKPYFCV